jgi:hypothetical protein
MKTKVMALAVLAVLGTTACASAAGQTAMNEPVPQSKVPVQVRVRNNKDDNVDVYAMVNGTYKHIMTVPAMETRQAQVNATARGVRLLVDPVGSNDAFLTNTILVNAGQGIDLTVASSLQRSSWAVD